jgi:hypothetical protein
MDRSRSTYAGALLGAGLVVFSYPAIVWGVANPCPFVWNQNLKTGSISEDVLKLQQFLNSDSATAIASSGAGSLGMETPKFGAMTRKAVLAFQNKYASEILVPHGLAQGTGIVGAATRAKLNALCSGTTESLKSGSVLGASTTAEVDSLTVGTMLQPVSSIIPENALHIPFTNFTLAAGSKDVEIRSLTVELAGPGSSHVFASIDLDDQESGNISTAYFNSQKKAIFRDVFTIAANTSRSFTLFGDGAEDLDDHAGEMPILQIAAIESSSPVSGTLPVRGSGQTANASLEIGHADISLGMDDPMVARTRYVGEANAAFSGIRISAGTGEDVRVDSITWQQNGTASRNDFTNTMTIINGKSYPAVTEDGRYYTSEIPGGIVIKKGYSIDATLRGDLLYSGYNRTIKFDIDASTDIAVTGLSYGFGIAPGVGGNAASSGESVFLTDTGDTDGASLTPFFSGSTITITSGMPTYIGK